MLCICRLWVVALNVSDMFIVAGLQITTRLAYIRLVARVAFQVVNARSIGFQRLQHTYLLTHSMVQSPS